MSASTSGYDASELQRWAADVFAACGALAGATRPAIGNNPLAFAAPVAGGVSLVFNIATSVVARGHVASTIPPGWPIPPDGEPTTDPVVALCGAMLPIPGHKGRAVWQCWYRCSPEA